MSARAEVLGRIRAALVGDGGPPPREDGIPRRYRAAGDASLPALLDLLAERLADYRAQVRRCPPGELTAVATGALAGRGARHLMVPPGLAATGLDPEALAAALPEVTITTDDGGLSAERLDAMDGVITGAAAAIAETGTIVLDGGAGQGRRVLSLIPDYHLCVIHAGQVVGLVPEVLPRLTPGRPLTWISGPSATSDIELDRVEGVHGPRSLEVILVSPA